MKNRIKNFFYGAGAALSVGLMSVMSNVACAEPHSDSLTPDVKKTLENNGTSSDALDGLTSTVTGIGKASYNLLFTAALFIGISAFIISIIILIVSNPQNRQDAKDSIIHKIFAFVLLGAVVAIVVGAVGVGRQINFG